MSFWLVAACLTLAAALAVMLPFLRPARRGTASDSHDLEVYRDQLGELERDVARGTLGEADAAEARAEIARRILRLEPEAGDAARGGSGAARMTAAAAVLAVPLVSWGLYSALGSPSLPAEPLSTRMAKDPQDSTIEELVARAEKHLAAAPDDGRGWEVLAPVYFRLKRYGDAENAYRQAIRLSGDSAGREAGLGEAITAHGGGVVSGEAEAAFERALKLDASAEKPRFFLAMAKAQEGRADEARSMWMSLASDLPSDSPWRGAVDEALAQLGPAAKGGPTREAAAAASGERGSAVASPGPSSDEVDAAGRMAPKDRMAMIEGMVGKLDQRLSEKSGPYEDWRRLVRSYLVLGRKEEAADAAARGVKALGAGSDGGKKLEAFAQAQGLGSRP